ncbi:MAG: hypothetical protein KME05_18625 [Gloeocapsa sp. UFS-A4-WI-NPMV-4B04]|nr:hypothetical protein [Gloeocapsa sp. UFS-A4-WI-NPMV-4B04]
MSDRLERGEVNTSVNCSRLGLIGALFPLMHGSSSIAFTYHLKLDKSVAQSREVLGRPWLTAVVDTYPR